MRVRIVNEMKGKQSLTRPEFLVQLARADLGRLSAPQRSRLLKELEAFCHDPRESLWGEMEPAPACGDIVEVQRCVLVLLEGTVIPASRPGAPAAARVDQPAFTIRDLYVESSPPSPETVRVATGATGQVAFSIAATAKARDYFLGIKRRPIIIARSTAIDVVVFLATVTLTQGALPTVARCADPHCPRKWFIRRGKKRFCDDRCRVRAFVRAQRAEMREAERRESERRNRRPASSRSRAHRRQEKPVPMKKRTSIVRKAARHTRKGGM